MNSTRKIFHGIPWSPNENEIFAEEKQSVILVNGIGFIQGILRLTLLEKFRSSGFKFLNVMHKVLCIPIRNIREVSNTTVPWCRLEQLL